MAEAGPGAGGADLHRGTRAIQKLVELAPHTGGLALWIRHLDVDDPDGPLVAATDGTTLYYGPGFPELPLSRQLGLIAHEVLHVALRHPQRLTALRRLIGGLDPALYNICADAIVNSALGHLAWLELPPDSVRLEDLVETALGTRPDPEPALLEWDLERLYRALDDRRPAGGSGGSRQGAGPAQEIAPGSGNGSRGEADSGRSAAWEEGSRSARARWLGAGIIRDLLPSPSDETPELEADRSRTWHERILRAHAGDGPQSMLRTLLADLPKTRIPWEQLLRTRLARGLSSKPSLSWSRPARSYLANRGRAGQGLRLPWEPGIASSRAVARLAVMVDVSGSIEDPLLERFASEIEAITRRLESRILVIIGDDQVRDLQCFEPGRTNLRGIRFQGGGGTDFGPLLEEAQRHRPDMGVFLTDLDGRCDYRPHFPVLWALTRAHAHREPPFGLKLIID